MAKILRDILDGPCVEDVFQRIKDAPVHHLEVVPGSDVMVRTACRRHTFASQNAWELVSPERCIYRVTCQECLAAMADVPTVVEVVKLDPYEEVVE